MNNAQRKELGDIIDKLEELRGQIDSTASEEREKYDNMPEALQSSEKGDALEQGADNLESAVSSIEEAIGYISEAREA